AEQLGRVGGGQPHRPRPCHVHSGPGRHTRGVGTVISGGKNVRQHRQVENLLERLITVGEFQQVEIGERHHDVFGLTTDPAAHVDVPVGGAGTGGIDVEADSRLALVAHSTPAAGDVERHRADVTFADEQHVLADFHHFTGDL